MIICKGDSLNKYWISISATKTVLNVKMDASDMTSIAVSKQKWTGWPADISDELSLAQIDIPKRHSLTVNVADAAQSTSSLNVSVIHLAFWPVGIWLNPLSTKPCLLALYLLNVGSNLKSLLMYVPHFASKSMAENGFMFIKDQYECFHPNLLRENSFVLRQWVFLVLHIRTFYFAYCIQLFMKNNS